MENIPTQYIKGLYRGTVTVLFILAVFFGVKTLAEIRSFSSMGITGNTITLSGHGEVKAVPDIANISFTISKDAKTVKDAQSAVAAIEKSALDFLKKNNIDDKDIKTQDASFNPKYETVSGAAPAYPCTIYGCPPNPGKTVIVGYTANESITVKIRNTDNVGAISEGLGTLGVTNLNGPNFSIDDEDTLKALARTKAINDAKIKAKALAKDLGVSLGKVAEFSESGNYPIMYSAKASMADGMATPAPAQLPKGENTISSDVTITYDIR